MNYPVVIVEVPRGEGYMGLVPDLPNCNSAGATPDEALKNTEAAILAWIDHAKECGLLLPAPGSFAKQFPACNEDG